MRPNISSLLIGAGIASAWTFGLGGMSAKAAAPATAQGFINYYTYAGDQRAAIRAGTAVFDGSFYPKRMEGPYNNFPDPDPGDDDAVPVDERDSYSSNLVGYFYPPKTGKVQFAISTDDPGALYFSTDDNPANSVQIATEPTWNGKRAFGAEARRTRVNDGTLPADRLQNQSKFFDVVAGKPYFIQSISSEGGGGDNNAVAFRYDTDAEFADGDKPILGQYLSPFSVPAAPVIQGQPRDAYLFAGGSATFSIGLDAAPTVTVSNIKWTKNGVDVPDSNSTTLTVPLTGTDDGAKFKAFVTTSQGNIESAEATANVATVSTEFTPGVAKLELYYGIGGTSIDSLTADAKFPDSPDEVKASTSFEGLVNLLNDYGARISGFIIPLETANYVFFMSADDNAQLFLSTDDSPANKKLIATEPQWNDPRQWLVTSRRDVDNPENRSDRFTATEWPGGNTINLQAGKRYYAELIYKEGGGGDNGGLTMIKEGATPPANGSPALSGGLMGANVRSNKGDPAITKQPVFPAQLEEGRSYRFSVDGVVTPAGFGFQPLISWQKNGTAIAYGKNLIIQNAKASDAGTYRAVVSAPSGKSVNSVESGALAVLPDTFPPVPSAATLLKNGKQEIGVAFDEDIKIASASDKANYSLSAGTIDSVRVVTRSKTGFDASLGVPEYNAVVLVASGLTAGQTYQLTVKNVEDVKGNKIPATGATASFKAEGQKTWNVVGANENKYVDDVVRNEEGSFDVISSGVAFWADYDEATFVNEKVKGDFDAKVQLVEQDPSSQWARTGLMAREGLDEGKIRPDRGECAMALEDGVYCVPKEKLFSRLQTVHANAAIRADAGVSNNGYENHWRAEDTYSVAWGNQLNSADGGFAPLDYPNVWMRLQREGNFLITYRSTDGQTWNQMTRREFQNLAAELYIGPFFAPELDNNPNADSFPGGIDDLLKHSVLAKFRNYSISRTDIKPPDGDLKFTVASLTGGKLHLEWTGANAKLQRADAVTGPWTDVAGATSPRDVDPTGAGAFYRLVGQ